MRAPIRAQILGRKVALGMLASAIVLGSALGPAAAPRTTTLEIRGKSGPLGQLPLVLDEGAAYVSASRLAATLKGTWTVKGSQGILTVNGRAAQFTRNQSRVVILGKSLDLDGPPRAGRGDWLLPEGFATRTLSRLAPGVTAERAAVTTPVSGKAPVRAVQSAALEEIRYRSYPSFTRIVIEADGAFLYRVQADEKEVQVQIKGLRVSGSQSEEVDDGLVKDFRLAPAAGADAVLRISLEGSAARIKDTVLAEPFRLVLDVLRPKEQGPVAPGNGRAQPLRLIVLDPGHGGHDTGAVGPSGLAEKEVVLDVTRRVARMLEESLGLKVAMTRSTDTFIPLRDRTHFANKSRADLFVSIHANAHPRSISEGVETYFLSSEATDREARQLAAAENGVVQLETPTARQKADVLKTILWDLAQSEFQQESSFLAETVQDSMTKSLRLVNRGVKQAGFYVLGGAAMPAVLIEVGFLTNPKEEKKLASSEHREAAARAIFAGLSEYKRRHDQRMRTAQLAPARAERAR